jgi:hypothetical protein
MHTLRLCKAAFDVCCLELCMCVGFNCLDHLPRVGPDGTEVLVQRGGEGPEVFWVFGRGCLCQSIGRQASGGVVQGRGLADTESAVPEGESKLRLGLGGGSGPQDLLGGGRDGVVYLVHGTLYGFSGAVQWGGAGQVPDARDQEGLQQEELILAREGEVREAVDEGQQQVFPLLEVSFCVGLGAKGELATATLAWAYGRPTTAAMWLPVCKSGDQTAHLGSVDSRPTGCALVQRVWIASGRWWGPPCRVTSSWKESWKSFACAARTF